MAQQIVKTGIEGESLDSGFSKVNENFTELYSDKLDKGTYTGTAQDLKNDIDGAVSGYKGAITISDTPTEDGIYTPTEAGTYTNAGGLIYDPEGVDKGFQVSFIKTGSSWVKNVAEVGVNTDLIVTNEELYLENSQPDFIEGLEVTEKEVYNSSNGVFTSNSSFKTVIVPINGSETKLTIKRSSLFPSSGYSDEFNGYPRTSNIINGNLSYGTNNLHGSNYITGFNAASTYFAFAIPIGSEIIITNELGEIFTSYDSINRNKNIDGQLITDKTLRTSPSLKFLTTNNLIKKEYILDNKYIQSSTGKVDNLANSLVVFIPIEPNKKYVFSSQTALNQGFYKCISFVTENGITVVAKSSDVSTENCVVEEITNGGYKILEYPDSAKYVAIVLGRNHIKDNLQLQFEEGIEATAYSGYGLDFDEMRNDISINRDNIITLLAQVSNATTIPSRWAGKRYIALGDSITDENYTPNIKYPTMMNDSFAFSSWINKAKSGQSMGLSSSGNYFSKATGEYNSIDWSIYDLATFALGTNDHGLDVPVGTIDSTDINNFYGAWNVVLSYIFNANPQIRIVLLTPFQKNAMNNANSGGHILYDYVNAIINIGKKYSCPVINLFNEAGINNVNKGTYTSDGLHLNALGHNYAGKYIISQIRNL